MPKRGGRRSGGGSKSGGSKNGSKNNGSDGGSGSSRRVGSHNDYDGYQSQVTDVDSCIGCSSSASASLSTTSRSTYSSRNYYYSNRHYSNGDGSSDGTSSEAEGLYYDVPDACHTAMVDSLYALNARHLSDWLEPTGCVGSSLQQLSTRNATLAPCDTTAMETECTAVNVCDMDVSVEGTLTNATATIDGVLSIKFCIPPECRAESTATQPSSYPGVYGLAKKIAFEFCSFSFPGTDCAANVRICDVGALDASPPFSAYAPPPSSGHLAMPAGGVLSALLALMLWR